MLLDAGINLLVNPLIFVKWFLSYCDQGTGNGDVFPNRKWQKPPSLLTIYQWKLGGGGFTSHWTVNITYHPETRLTIAACLSFVPTGISRLLRNLTQPILGKLSILDFSLSPFICGKTNERIRPGFLTHDCAPTWQQKQPQYASRFVARLETVLFLSQDTLSSQQSKIYIEMRMSVVVLTQE